MTPLYSKVVIYDFRIYEVTNRYPRVSKMVNCHLKVTDLVTLDFDIVKGVSFVTPPATSIYTFELNNEQFYVGEYLLHIHTFQISFCAVNTGLVNNFQFFKVAKTLGF